MWHDHKLGIIPVYQAAGRAALDLDLADGDKSGLTLPTRGYRLAFVAEVPFPNLRFSNLRDGFFPSTDLLLTPWKEYDAPTLRSAVYQVFEFVERVAGRNVRNCETPTDGGPCSCQRHLDEVLLALTCGGVQHTRLKTTISRPEGIYVDLAAHWVECAGEDSEQILEHLCGHVKILLRPLAKKRSVADFKRRICNSHGRNFFALDDNRFGLCHKQTRRGDVVVALFGGGVPFVVRKREHKAGEENRWELIGECYVHDYMDGRIVDTMLDRAERSETYVLD